MIPVVIGSRAFKERVPSARTPRDWDVLMSRDDARRLGTPRRAWPHKCHFDAEGTIVEVFYVDERPLHRAALALEQQEPRRLQVPLVGECAVARLETQFVFKSTYVAFPGHFYKTVADYHALKALIGPLGPEFFELARLGLAQAKARHAHAWTDGARRPETCAFGHHDARDDWSLHAALHARLGGAASPGWPAPDARALGPDRAQWVKRIAEEAMVIAIEQRGTRAGFRFALRLLTTRLLPLGWRYFTADAWPEIAAAGAALDPVAAALSPP